MKKVYILSLLLSGYCVQSLHANDNEKTVLSLLSKTACPQKRTFSDEVLGISPVESDTDLLSNRLPNSVSGHNSPTFVMSPHSLTDRGSYLSSVLFGCSKLLYLTETGGDFLTDLERGKGLVGHALSLDERIKKLELSMIAVLSYMRQNNNQPLRTSPVLGNEGHQFLFTEHINRSYSPATFEDAVGTTPEGRGKRTPLIVQKDNPSLVKTGVQISSESSIEVAVAPFSARVAFFQDQEKGHEKEMIEQTLRQQELRHTVDREKRNRIRNWLKES